MMLEREISYPNRYLSRLRERLEPKIGDKEITITRYIDPLDFRFYNRIKINGVASGVCIIDAEQMEDIYTLHGDDAINDIMDKIAAEIVYLWTREL